MSIAGRVSWLVVLCASMLLSEPAVAACSKSPQEIKTSPEWARFDRQYEEGKANYLRGRDKITEEYTYAGVVQAGYLLGRQARYIGDSAERDQMFTCLRESIERGFAYFVLTRDHHFDTAQADKLFQSALLGILDEVDFQHYGVDTKKHYPSIFEADWTGLWDVTFLGPRAPGGKKRLNVDVALDFRQRGDGAWLVKMGEAGDMRGPYAARADGEVISFELPKTEAIHFKFALSQDNDTSCRGTMTTTNAKTGRATNWRGTGKRQ